MGVMFTFHNHFHTQEAPNLINILMVALRGHLSSNKLHKVIAKSLKITTLEISKCQV